MFMSKGKRYTEEFKIEAVKQVTERGCSVYDVAYRLGISVQSLYDWRAKYSQELSMVLGPFHMIASLIKWLN